jgi:ribosomal protein S18 acetylase RimI-like enzyme
MTSVRPANETDLPAFFAYLDDHLRDNDTGGTPRFQPLLPGQPRIPAGLRLSFIKGVTIAAGEPGWRRLWLALGPTGDIAGHVDLRARPEPASSHRAMLGMGVHRAYRRRGLGKELVETALAWARADTDVRWVDLEVLADNAPACALYLDCGFTMVARIADMLRIGGESCDLIYMTRPLR